MALKKNVKSLLGVIIFVLTSCSHTQAPIIEGWHQSPANHSNYIVQKGDTLYSIAWAFAVDFRDLAKFNHLAPPYNLHTGQKLQMVPATLQVYAQSPPQKTQPLARTHKFVPRIFAVENKSPQTALPKPTVVAKKSIIYQRTPGKMKWLWPASGKVIRNFSLTAGGNHGIEIAGRLGEPIVASAAGKVVYSGSGLRGYGNLIIIKHSDTYLSAYAYNKVLLVKEGTFVKAGQKIALMGSNNAGQVRVHFEIRRNGKPVNPMKFIL